MFEFEKFGKDFNYSCTTSEDFQLSPWRLVVCANETNMAFP